MRASRSVAAAFATFALVASACGAASDTETAASLPDTADAASVTTEQSADLEAAFVPTAAGGQLDFNTLRGQDVLLWFWAPW